MDQSKNDLRTDIENQSLPDILDLWLLNQNEASSEKNFTKKPKNLENSKPDAFNHANKTTSNNQMNEECLNGVSKGIVSIADNELMVDTLMETVDLSDISFSSYNDFILGDCTCFKDASQYIDPTIGDNDCASISFNNSNSVQLFKESKNDSKDSELCYRNEDSFNLDNVLISKSTDEYRRISFDDLYRNETYDFYHIFEVIDDTNGKGNDNASEISKNDIFDSKFKKSKRNKESKIDVPMRKGRRYLPSFKQKVLEYASNHTFKQTASHFHINCNTITEWSHESKRLSIQKSTTLMPGSVSNYKTDVNGTPITKTEINFLNDDFSLETDSTETHNTEKDLPPCNMRSDERFLKWIKKNRLEKRELSRDQVYNVARYCLKKFPSGKDKPVWFIAWFKRLNSVLQNSVKSNPETEKYIMYPNNFKLEVALYARIFTKNSAARVFNVPRRRMFDWFNRLNPVMDSFITDVDYVKDNGEINRNNLTFSDMNNHKNRIYLELKNWFQEKSKEGSSPTGSEIKVKAKEIFSANGIDNIKFSAGWLNKFCKRYNIKLRYNDDDDLLLWILAQYDNNVSLSHPRITEKSAELIGKRKEFKGNKGWTLRFLKRHCNFLQKAPTIKDKLPEILNERITEFQNEIKRNVTSLQIQSSSVGCVDEIPVSFSYPQDDKATNLPLLRKTGFENCQAVVILCAIADGRILPPTVIFKGNGYKQLLSDGDVDILILYQQEGFIDSATINDWVNDVWLNCVSNKSILIADSFEPHRSNELRDQLLSKGNCFLSIIPEGCTSQLQPLSVEICNVFQDLLKNEWKQYLLNPGLSSTKTTNWYPDQDTILQWIRTAYQKIKQNPVSIINSFKITGLLN